MKVGSLLSLVAIAVAFAMPTAVHAQAASSDAPPPTTTAADSEATTDKPAGSPWGWLALPKVTMPKVSMPKIEMPKMPADPLAPVKASAKKVGEGTKKAWEGTKEIFTFGGGKSDGQGASGPATGKQPSVWKKMFGREEPKPEGPQTVAEWMAQPRLDP